MALTRVVNGVRMELSEQEEIETRAEWAANEKAAAAIRYQKQRQAEYPELTEQLDMLWHELDAMGSIAKDGQWFQAIKEVKDKYPKPE